MIWFSPSQINTFQQCQRKWAWRHLDHIDTPSNAAAQEGLKGHEILERYLTTASIDMSDPLADLCGTGLHHYPAPCTPGLQVEHHFGIVIGGYHFHGYKDVQLLQQPLREQGCPGCAGLSGLCNHCIPQVWDHKFTSNLRWAKSDADLLGDVQAVIYAFDAMLKSNQTRVRCNWIYYQRRGAKRNQKTQLVLSAEQLVKPLRGIVNTAAEIHAVHSSYTTAKQLPPCVEQCTAYGGCVYRQYCNLSQQEIFNSMMRSTAAFDVFNSG